MKKKGLLALLLSLLILSQPILGFAKTDKDIGDIYTYYNYDIKYKIELPEMMRGKILSFSSGNLLITFDKGMFFKVKVIDIYEQLSDKQKKKYSMSSVNMDSPLVKDTYANRSYMENLLKEEALGRNIDKGYSINKTQIDGIDSYYISYYYYNTVSYTEDGVRKSYTAKIGEGRIYAFVDKGYLYYITAENQYGLLEKSPYLLHAISSFSIGGTNYIPTLLIVLGSILTFILLMWLYVKNEGVSYELVVETLGEELTIPEFKESEDFTTNEDDFIYILDDNTRNSVKALSKLAKRAKRNILKLEAINTLKNAHLISDKLAHKAESSTTKIGMGEKIGRFVNNAKLDISQKLAQLKANKELREKEELLSISDSQTVQTASLSEDKPEEKIVNEAIQKEEQASETSATSQPAKAIKKSKFGLASSVRTLEKKANAIKKEIKKEEAKAIKEAKKAEKAKKAAEAKLLKEQQNKTDTLVKEEVKNEAQITENITQVEEKISIGALDVIEARKTSKYGLAHSIKALEKTINALKKEIKKEELKEAARIAKEEREAKKAEKAKKAKEAKLLKQQQKEEKAAKLKIEKEEREAKLKAEQEEKLLKEKEEAKKLSEQKEAELIEETKDNQGIKEVEETQEIPRIKKSKYGTEHSVKILERKVSEVIMKIRKLEMEEAVKKASEIREARKAREITEEKIELDDDF